MSKSSEVVAKGKRSRRVETIKSRAHALEQLNRIRVRKPRSYDRMMLLMAELVAIIVALDL